jgi:hypothetical protein
MKRSDYWVMVGVCAKYLPRIASPADRAKILRGLHEYRKEAVLERRLG